MKRILRTSLALAFPLLLLACSGGDEKSSAFAAVDPATLESPAYADIEAAPHGSSLPKAFADEFPAVQEVVAWNAGDPLPSVEVMLEAQSKEWMFEFKTPASEAEFKAQIEAIGVAYRENPLEMFREDFDSIHEKARVSASAAFEIVAQAIKKQDADALRAMIDWPVFMAFLNQEGPILSIQEFFPAESRAPLTHELVVDQKLKLDKGGKPSTYPDGHQLAGEEIKVWYIKEAKLRSLEKLKSDGVAYLLDQYDSKTIEFEGIMNPAKSAKLAIHGVPNADDPKMSEDVKSGYWYAEMILHNGFLTNAKGEKIVNRDEEWSDQKLRIFVGGQHDKKEVKILAILDRTLIEYLKAKRDAAFLERYDDGE